MRLVISKKESVVARYAKIKLLWQTSVISIKERNEGNEMPKLSYWGIRYRCENCGNRLIHGRGFQTWQVARKATGQHRLASWCSRECFDLAEKRKAGLKRHYTKNGICNLCAGVEKVSP